VERSVECPENLHIFSTSSDENTGSSGFPQTKEQLECVITITERSFLDISTLSTTTKFLDRILFFILDIVHNQACAAVEA